MKTTREEKKKEAVERMRLIGVFPQTIRQFENEDRISATIGAACYWIDEDTAARVRAFEEKNNALVFHVVPVTYQEIGQTETYFYVCDDPEEWPLDREDLEAGEAFCYVNNLAQPLFSEFGRICFELTPGAGIRRTY